MAVAGRIEDAESGTALPRIDGPGAAATDVIVTITRHPGNTVLRGSFVVCMPMVLAPFPYAAVHVIETKIVGWILTCRRRFAHIAIEVSLFFR